MNQISKDAHTDTHTNNKSLTASLAGGGIHTTVNLTMQHRIFIPVKKVATLLPERFEDFFKYLSLVFVRVIVHKYSCDSGIDLGMVVKRYFMSSLAM